jgi:DNA polymerase-3 subunit epsilon
MALLDALNRWRRPRAAIDDGRWVVLDVETSGLDARRDRLLAVAAVAVRVADGRASISLGDSFEVVIRQPEAAGQPDRSNILLHGIGIGAQRAGVPRAPGLQALAAWVGASPLVAFHAAFDRTMLDRACAAEGQAPLHDAWLDLEPLAGVLQPRVKARSLDEWMQALDIRCAVRHQAAADTLATAELLLKLWPLLREELPQPTFQATAALAAARRWLPS